MIRKGIIVVLVFAAVGTLVWMAMHPPRPIPRRGGGHSSRRICSWSSEARTLSLYYIATSGTFGNTRRFHIAYCWHVDDTSPRREIRWPFDIFRYAVGVYVCMPSEPRSIPRPPSGYQYTPRTFAALHIELPLHVWFILFATYPTIAFVRGPLRRWRRRRKGLCTACAYDLTGNESGVCPECGDGI
jgi:hypothetical protein